MTAVPAQWEVYETSISQRAKGGSSGDHMVIVVQSTVATATLATVLVVPVSSNYGGRKEHVRRLLAKRNAFLKHDSWARLFELAPMEKATLAKLSPLGVLAPFDQTAVEIGLQFLLGLPFGDAPSVSMPDAAPAPGASRRWNRPLIDPLVVGEGVVSSDPESPLPASGDDPERRAVGPAADSLPGEEVAAAEACDDTARAASASGKDAAPTAADSVAGPGVGASGAAPQESSVLDPPASASAPSKEPGEGSPGA